MNNIVNLHITQDSKIKKNKFSYQEYLDEHLSKGKLQGVELNDGVIMSKEPIFHLVGNKIEDASESKLKINNHNVEIVTDPETGVDCLNLFTGYLSVPMDSPIVNSSEDFTIEWWERAMGTFTSSAIFQNDYDTTAGVGNRGIMIGHTGTKVFMATEGATSWNIANDVAHKNTTTNQWVHWAFVKSGDVYTTWRNGAKHHTVTYTAKFGSLNGFNIGGWLSTNTRNIGYNAYIKHFKIWDYARYTDVFHTNVSEAFKDEMYRLSPPLEIPDTLSSVRLNWEGSVEKVDVVCNYDDTHHTKLLLHGDELIDASMYNHTIVRTNAINIVEGKFDKAFELGAGYARVSIKDINLSGTHDFTIDWWEFIKPNTGKDHGMLSTRGTSKGLMLGYHTDNKEGSKIAMYLSTNRHSWNKLDGVSMGTKVTNRWVHRAVCWSAKDTTFHTFQDGVKTNTIPVTLTSQERFETAVDYHTILKGWSGAATGSRASEFRITDRCEWTEDFVPAIRPYDIGQQVIPCKRNEIVEIPTDVKSIQVKQILEDDSQTLSNFSLEGVYSPRHEIIRPKDIEDTGELLLYDRGKEFEEITGGWSGTLWDGSHDHGYFSKKEDYLEFGDNQSGLGIGGFVHNYGIDLTPYKKLILDIQMADHYNYSGAGANLVAAICKDNKPNNRAVTYTEVYNRANSNARVTVEIDLSKYNGIFHIGVFARNQAHGSNSVIGRLHEAKLIKNV